MTAREGLATTGPRDGVEVWTTCATCAAPVRLLGENWHHEGPGDHRVVPADDEQARSYSHVYNLAALVSDRRQR